MEYRARSAITTAAMREAPIPIPAFAPVESPLDAGEVGTAEFVAEVEAVGDEVVVATEDLDEVVLVGFET
jgi:hypothetical protein